MSKKSQVTQKQIAQKIGVSQTAVSLVLSNTETDKVSEATRQQVLRVADELGYVPQAAAKSLVQGRSNTVGLVLAQSHYQVFQDPYIPNILTGLTQVCRKLGIRVLVEHINSEENISTIRNLIKGGEIDGMLINGVIDAAGPLIQEGLPIVALAHRDYDDLKPYTVAIDHQQGVQDLLHHVIERGYQHIACITYGPPSDTTLAGNSGVGQRLATYRAVLEEAGLVYHKDNIRFGNYDPITGYEAMQSLLEQKPLPEAVYCMNDYMALGAMKAIQDASLRIPDDIAVVGYDDMRFAEFAQPALTTVRAPEVQLGEVAGELLIDLIDEKQPDQRILLLETELMMRESC